MKKILKHFLSLLILVFIISLTSCKLELFEEEEETANNQATKVVANLVDNNVTINLADNTSTVTTTEEAVEVAYDSVVCVYVMEGKSATSAGSGVIIAQDEEGYYIATCYHVIEDASDLIVLLTNGSYLDATVVGGDKITDLAVLKVVAEDLKVATIITDFSTVKLGSEAIAIGNPLGTLANSVTKGVISSTSRNIEMDDGSVHNLIQTDAAVNGGNSGGGLFNNQGQLIGIVSAKYSATGVEGLAFAIPSNTVLEIVTDLIEKGYVEGRTSLGITISDGYYRSGGFFGSLTRVVYVSYVDPYGSAYGILEKENIIKAISVKYASSEKENVALTSFRSADEVNAFLDGLDLEIGDQIIFTILSSTSSSQTKEVTVTLKQYVYGS